MTREQVLRRLGGARAELAGLGVRSLDLSGSVARGEASADSDVDLLVEFDKPFGLFHFFRVQRRLEEILGCRVDLVMREAVNASCAPESSPRPSVPRSAIACVCQTQYDRWLSNRRAAAVLERDRRFVERVRSARASLRVGRGVRLEDL